MNLFNKLKNNSVTPLFQRKSGHFVVDDNNGIALLAASSYKNKKEPILLIMTSDAHGYTPQSPMRWRYHRRYSCLVLTHQTEPDYVATDY